VHALGHGEERVRSSNNAPLGIQAGAAHQGHERVEHLRDAASIGGGRDVHHSGSLERLSQRLQLGDHVVANDGRVVIERLLGQRDSLHRWSVRF